MSLAATIIRALSTIVVVVLILAAWILVTILRLVFRPIVRRSIEGAEKGRVSG